MSNPEIRALVDQFVVQLEAAVRAEAIASVRAVLEGSPAAKKGPGRPPKTVKPSKGPAGTNGRRTSEQIEATAKTIERYVKANPGKRGEDIKKALRIPSEHWMLPVHSLLKTKRIKTKGEKRATEYFPA